MITIEQARALDQADPLREYRSRFRLPEGVIHLNGNSLGALPVRTADRMREVVEREWGESLTRSWNDHDWVGAPRRIGAKIARLIGANEDEVIVTDSTSVNLFKLIVAAAGARDGAILAERDSFPTDAYVAEQAAVLLGRAFRTAGADALAEAMTPDVAVAAITQVDYRTATRHDMAALTATARASGTSVVWDLSHSVGAVPLDLARDGVELAVGCGYKYLNGGPGAPSFVYVARALQGRLSSPIAGWWSHAEPFAYASGYRPHPGIDRFSTGTPPMLGLLALEGGVDIANEAGKDRVWEKSVRLYDLFSALVAERCPGLTIVSPADARRRGSHIALAHPQALAIVRAMIARGVIGDFRAPDVARFGLAPLYLGFEDVWRAVDVLAGIMEDQEWRDDRFARGGVVT